MSKKHHILLSSLLGLCLLVAIGFGAFTLRERQRYTRAVQDACHGALLSAVTQIERMQLYMDKALLSQDEGQSAALVSRIGSDAAAVQGTLSALPLSHSAMADAVRLCSQISDYAATLLEKANAALSDADAQTLVQIEEACRQLHQALLNACAQLQSGDVQWFSANAYMADADANARPPESIAGAVDYPTLIYDGPFSDAASQDAPKGLGTKSVDEAQALLYAHDFLGEQAQQVSLTQESSGDIPAWGVCAQGENGILQLAVTKQGGHVLWMFPESAQYEARYGLQDCRAAAQDFLASHGYGDMQLTFWQIYAGMATLSYAAVQQGVLLYPDLVKVQVRMDTLAIVGLEARRYLTNHTRRDGLTPALTQEEAQGAVSQRLSIRSAQLCLIPQNSAERLCWEFTGEYQNDTYYIYIDAQTGRQADIQKLVQTPSGPKSE